MILWGDEALSILGSHIGIPIQTDHFTSQRNKADFARILVEVDTTQTLLRELDIQLPNGRELKQAIIYEVEPILCSKCHRLGHIKEACTGTLRKARARSQSRPRRTQLIPDVVMHTHQTVECKEDSTVHRDVPQQDPVIDGVNALCEVSHDMAANLAPNIVLENEEVVQEAEFQEIKRKKGMKQGTDDLLTGVQVQQPAVIPSQTVVNNPILLKTPATLPQTAANSMEKLGATGTTTVCSPVTAAVRGPTGKNPATTAVLPPKNAVLSTKTAAITTSSSSSDSFKPLAFTKVVDDKSRGKMSSYASSCDGGSLSDNDGEDVEDDDDEAPEELPIPSSSRKKSKEHLRMKPQATKTLGENGKRKGSRGHAHPQ